MLWRAPKDVPDGELANLRQTFKKAEESILRKHFPLRERVSWKELDEVWDIYRRVEYEKERLA